MFGTRKPKKKTGRTDPVVHPAAGPSSSSAGVGAAHPKTPPKKQVEISEDLVERIQRAMKVEHPPLRGTVVNDITMDTEAHRSISMFIYGYMDDPYVEIYEQMGIANSEAAYRFQNPGDNLGRMWFADESSGRTMEMFYNGWTERWDKHAKAANEEILKVMSEIGGDSDADSNKMFKKLALDKLRDNKETIHSLERQVKGLTVMVEATVARADLHKSKAEDERKKCSELRQKLINEINKKYDELGSHGIKYMVDLRLRALLQHWGITNQANTDPQRWQKYDISNAFAMEHTKILDQILNGISEPAGNVLTRSIQTIGVKQSMRVASIHRIVHGADLLADCRIVALRLLKVRHDKDKSTEVGLLPKDVASRKEDSTFTSVFTPTAAATSTQTPGAGAGAASTSKQVPAPISVTAPKVADTNGWKWAQFYAEWRNWDPLKSTADSTWQGLFDATVLQLYNLDRVACQNILIALTAPPPTETDAAPEEQDPRRAEREVLLSHAAFISKWVTITEMVHHYASRALRFSNANPTLWQHWRGQWFRLRKTLTIQTFGEHHKLAPGKAYRNNPAPSDPWSRRKKRGLFHDYVGLFGQVCKLFNRPRLVTKEEWAWQLKQLDWERWNLYRHAVQTWVHRDAYGGRDLSQYDNNGRPLQPVAVNLWTEYNWIYETDEWKHAHRTDPQKPVGASKFPFFFFFFFCQLFMLILCVMGDLWDPLPATDSFKDFTPTIEKFHVPAAERGAQIKPESIVPGHIEMPADSTAAKPLNLTWRNYWMKQKPEEWEDYVKEDKETND
ncbi:hypothetical protein QBC40DRAFT_227919 [Triangularia verruculosa]|uniref:Uncharacterized protein n=1 Tax=Triangularia verruculosa TaxID=2587418 RepID=A0AAN6XF72_9PEZI|nr:hypothetical protein QBC40DRAFT_227919 [Triangularia verruculosa]